ncbi:MAG TPA: nucleotidyltransferase family protein [Steroidobacteraceae bacterium]
MIAGFSDAETRLVHLLREPGLLARARPEPGQADELFVVAERHGVTSLLAQHLGGAETHSWCERFRATARAQAAWEIGHRAVLRAALSSLNAHDIEPVLFKGTALAYSTYSNPVLRMRGDTDLLVRERDQVRVTRTLLDGGFASVDDSVAGRLGYQASFVWQGPGGSHALDVHWRINDSEVLSRLFTYDELRAAAVELPALAPGALAASPVHALLLACMHRGVHRHSPYYVADEPCVGGNRLIWLYDMHLLAGSFDANEWIEFVSSARSRGLLGICADGLAAARACFATTIPEAVWAELQRPHPGEPASDYLDAGPLRQQWLDLRAVPGAQRKWRQLRGLLFPPAAYMRGRFATATVQWLPWLYARRALAGTWRRVRGRLT